MQLNLRWALLWFGRPRNRPITFDDLVDAETRALQAEERLAGLEGAMLAEVETAARLRLRDAPDDD